MPRNLTVACFTAAALVATDARAANSPQNNVSAIPAADAASFEFSTGFDYSVGSYGAPSDTTVFDVPFGAKVQAGPVRVEGSIPYLHIKGPGVAAGDVVVSQRNAPVSSHSGIGDLTLIGGWTVYREDTLLPGIELAGTIKLPTAGTNLGTGKTDFTAQVNLFHSLTTTTLLFGSLGYQWLGSPAGFPLKSGIRATAGINFKPQDNIAAGITLDYREKYESSLSDYLSFDPYLLWRFADNIGVSTYAIIGATNAAPDWGAGVRLILYTAG